MNPRPALYTGALLAVIGWLAFMVSFWLPDPANQALNATALSLLVPGLVMAVGTICFWREIEEYRPTTKKQVYRCTECATEILDPAGTTIGDRLAEELAIEPTPIRRNEGDWRPPRTSPFNYDNGGPIA